MKPISAPAHGAAPTRDGDGGACVVPVFDGHNDLLTTLQWPDRAGERDPFARNAAGHLDLPRMREGGILDPEGTWREDLGLDVVVRHVDHLVDRLGVEGVALGSDFEGARVPSAIGDATGLPAVLRALREGGYDAPTIDAIAHANWWRVWKEVRPR